MTYEALQTEEPLQFPVPNQKPGAPLRRPRRDQTPHVTARIFIFGASSGFLGTEKIDCQSGPIEGSARGFSMVLF